MDRRGEEEACSLDGPEMLEEGEVEEELREGLVEVEEEKKWGRKEGACCCERVREERRTRR